jgi:hypothetical protein
MDLKKLSGAVSLYGKYFTQKKFQEMLQHAARVGHLASAGVVY